jgi:hypothetical protein
MEQLRDHLYPTLDYIHLPTCFAECPAEICRFLLARFRQYFSTEFDNGPTYRWIYDNQYHTHYITKPTTLHSAIYEILNEKGGNDIILQIPPANMTVPQFLDTLTNYCTHSIGLTKL